MNTVKDAILSSPLGLQMEEQGPERDMAWSPTTFTGTGSLCPLAHASPLFL